MYASSIISRDFLHHILGKAITYNQGYTAITWQYKAYDIYALNPLSGEMIKECHEYRIVKNHDIRTNNDPGYTDTTPVTG